MARDEGAKENSPNKETKDGAQKITFLRFFKKQKINKIHFNLNKSKTHRTLFQRANVYKFSDLIVVDKGFKQSCKIGLTILLQNVFLNNYLHAQWLVPGTFHNVMMFMIGTMGMWILNHG